MGIWLPAALGMILVRAVLFQDRKNLTTVLPFASSSFFTFLYPGFFLAWIVRISSLPDPSLSHPVLPVPRVRQRHGRLLRRQPLGRLHAAQPSRQPAEERRGVHRGIRRVPDHGRALPAPRAGLPALRGAADIVIGLATGATVILGDLLESGLKRSARVKDSGHRHPGARRHAGLGGFDAFHGAPFLLFLPPGRQVGAVAA